MSRGKMNWRRAQQDTKAAAARRKQDHLRVLTLHTGCWCGGAWGHDWPGRADGAPHPR